MIIFKKSSMKINIQDFKKIPNIISLFRLLLTLPISYIFLNYNKIDGGNEYVIYIILIAFISDLLDGYIARKTNSVTELGKIIDPLADKCLTAIVVFSMWYYNYFSTTLFCIIVFRDILIFVAGFITSLKIKKVVSSDYIGKFTVFTIGLAILVKLYFIELNKTIEFIIFWSILVTSLISLVNYFIKGYILLRKNVDFKKNNI